MATGPGNKGWQAVVGQAHPAGQQRPASIGMLLSHCPLVCTAWQAIPDSYKVHNQSMPCERPTGCLSGWSASGPKPPPPPPPKPVMRPAGALGGAAVDTPVTLAAMPAACKKT